jgi:hypothetical protein
MVQKQIDVRARRDGSQALQKFVSSKDQVACAVVPRVAEGAVTILDLLHHGAA